MGGYYYKVWSMKAVNPQHHSYTFVEGIGALNDPLYSISPESYYDFTSNQLRCFSSGTHHSPCNPPLALPGVGNPKYQYAEAAYFDNNISCRYSPLEVGGVNNSNDIHVYPSPGGAEMAMKVPESLVKGILIINDAQGRIIQNMEVGHDKIVRIGQYLHAEGVYYYTLQDKGTGQRYAGRFIYR
jgi:hypothetical protein